MPRTFVVPVPGHLARPRRGVPFDVSEGPSRCPPSSASNFTIGPELNGTRNRIIRSILSRRAEAPGAAPPRQTPDGDDSSLRLDGPRSYRCRSSPRIRTRWMIGSIHSIPYTRLDAKRATAQQRTRINNPSSPGGFQFFLFCRLSRCLHDAPAPDYRSYAQRVSRGAENTKRFDGTVMRACRRQRG